MRISHLLSQLGILSTCLGLSAVSYAVEDSFVPKGAGVEYFENIREAFDLSVLGEMLFNFYNAMLTEDAVFQYLIQVGDSLLAPLLGPLVIVCSGTRLLQEMHQPDGDIFGVIYATGTVILIITIYRIAMTELTSTANALINAIAPGGYSFKNTMESLEQTVDLFNNTKKNKDPIARLVDKSLSLYTEYFLAWGSKWGVMVLHGLLNYLRSVLFALNYVLGIFLLPFLIIKQSSLPRNWLMITAFIVLWAIVEQIMIAVVGMMGVAALAAALNVESVLPIFSESLFYVMLATVNILIGAAMLSSIWIVKSYLLSPGSISAAAALFSLPAISLGKMAANMANKGTLSAMGMAKASANARGDSRQKPSLPLPSDIFGGRKSGGRKNGGASSQSKKTTPNEAQPQMNSGYRMRTILEHRGKLNKEDLPGNVTAVSRVGRKHSIRR